MTRADHLRAVIADPDGDAPRLAFAEWCESNGEPDRGIEWRNANDEWRRELPADWPERSLSFSRRFNQTLGTRRVA